MILHVFFLSLIASHLSVLPYWQRKRQKPMQKNYISFLFTWLFFCWCIIFCTLLTVWWEIETIKKEKSRLYQFCLNFSGFFFCCKRRFFFVVRTKEDKRKGNVSLNCFINNFYFFLLFFYESLKFISVKCGRKKKQLEKTGQSWMTVAVFLLFFWLKICR